ncbi:MAG: BRCT domain-containing protein [Myxococcales bacterium]|nr:BRCT domain-containing protein [Myxococcales bacterium]
MGLELSLDDIRRAWDSRDPDLASLIVGVAAAPDPRPAQPPREGALSYAGFTAQLGNYKYKRDAPQARARYRIDTMRALEAPNAEVPLPPRLQLHSVLLDLWRKDGAYERAALLEVIRKIPLCWGPWRGLKQIFKEAEARGDNEVLGALAARFDAAYATKAGNYKEISRRTMGYLVRRAWRYLRRIGQSLPPAYVDAAIDFLRAYADDTSFERTWVFNHILHHETKKYTRRNFRVVRSKDGALTERAFGELWRRTPRPVLGLLERASSEQVRTFAVKALKTDFRASLREVEAPWVARLIAVDSATVDDFVVWLLQNVPKFEQGRFRELGLHVPVLRLLDSKGGEAVKYAAAYARTHARDLELDRLLRLANSRSDEVRKLAFDLLGDRDPRKDVGLDAWGQLLGTQYAHDLAASALRKHFSARELTPEWFKERLLGDRKVFDFASDLLTKVHTHKSLGAAFFRDLLDDPRITTQATNFALEALTRFQGEDFGRDFLARMILHPHARETILKWIAEERIKAEDLGAPFWRAVAFQATWDSDPFIKELIHSGRPWARDLKFDENLAKSALGFLSDVRRFSPGDLGFDWLMQLALRSEPHYHEFALEYMTKALLPADFAPKQAIQQKAAPAAAKKIDLGGKSFLFTGKLATMVRDEAEAKVTGAGGKNASSVTAKLDYLVIGDDGSPLYGQGRKGSKQVAAEKLVEKGAGIKVISETAFLQMLAGEQREFTADAVGAGCDRLWEMATGPGPADAPQANFARHYIRRHHPDISLALTDRPVDPGAEIPASYLTWARVRPLLVDARSTVRQFGLELARWELARWAPPIADIVEVTEAPYPEVREFFARGLLADESVEHKRYRIDPGTLTATAVYGFCESLVPETRALGMQLIHRYPKLAIPEELFRLSESPDRQVTAFVVRTIWSLYRDRGITLTWKPTPRPEPKQTGKAKPSARPDTIIKGPPAEGSGPPARPGKLPASHEALQAFMRRMLFSIPPAKLPSEAKTSDADANKQDDEPKKRRARPLPARKAKLSLIEAMRDLAVRERAFADLAAPLLREFMGSRGASERAACMVALVRIGAAHPDLKVLEAA